MPKRPSPRRAGNPLSEPHWLGRWFTTARREGLLALLTPEVWHTLSALLSFTSRDGSRHFTLDQLAVAIGQSRETAEERLAGLVATTWRGQTLAQLEYASDGTIVGATLAPLEVLAQISPDPDGPPPAAGHAAVAGDGALATALARVGLNETQIAALLKSYPPEHIQRQLDWLPAREARNPAALLIRAIEHDWDAPRSSDDRA